MNEVKSNHSQFESAESLIKKIEESSEYIKTRIPASFGTPQIGIVLGSGLGVLADLIKDKIEINYTDIPNFPVSTVAGHEGKLIIGELNGKKVLAMKGRFHYYEGYDMHQVVHSVRVMKKLGINNLLLTNAAGAINESFSPGELMLIKDHINLSGQSPLRGQNLECFGPRFPDMTYTYDPGLRKMIKEIAQKLNIKLNEGVYYFFTGPTYETPAEIRAMRVLGADATGMSTAPEAIAASHCGMKVAAISCLCNMAAGILDKPLSHEDVVDSANKAKDHFIKLILEMIGEWPV